MTSAREYLDFSAHMSGLALASRKDGMDALASEYAKIATALREAAEMREALEALVTKLDAVSEATSGIWMLAKLHGCEYDGPNYSEEMAVARRILGGDHG